MRRSFPEAQSDVVSQENQLAQEAYQTVKTTWQSICVLIMKLTVLQGDMNHPFRIINKNRCMEIGHLVSIGITMTFKNLITILKDGADITATTHTTIICLLIKDILPEIIIGIHMMHTIHIVTIGVKVYDLI